MTTITNHQADYQIETVMNPYDYFGDYSKVSKSMLWTFRRSRQEYYRRYVKQDAPEETQSSQMELGTVVHTMLLEPLKTSEVCAVAPYDDFRKKEAREWKRSAEAAGKIILKPDEHSLCVAMRDSMANTFGHLLSQPGPVEEPILWVDRESEIHCKCKPDKIVEVNDETWVLDVKTTSDATPQAFRKSCENFGYWLQDAHYRAGVERVAASPVLFVFLVVQNCWPYHSAAYTLDKESQAKADEMRAELLAQLKYCHQQADWRDWWLDNPNEISIREWAW